MAVLKCKMCGGGLNLAEGASTAECEYCGSVQTVPMADDEKKLNMFVRANRLRAACDFDKAAGIYEAIIVDFPEEAEAYWGLVLCKYGIEYVDDPATGKKIPTCHRSAFESVIKDSNVELAQEYADVMARRLYREEAKQIEELRKNIIGVSSNEDPYDIFICYKETDFEGKRTLDSVLAMEIYEALTDKGHRVFFSRISLEDKLGTEYEPYIFAALNSAKIMLVIGTDFEYFNAVWVKNEWSRFLKLMAQDKSKHLIPCYKGIDAYDMPEEFARLQAQDLDKMGAIQDIVRGVQKLLPKQEQSVKETVIVQQTTSATAPLLERAFMFLEDGDWANADKFCEQALNLEPKNATAYLGKLMAELKVKKKAQLRNCTQPFDNNSNYQKSIRFADAGLKAELQGYIAHINTRNETDYKDKIYNDAIEKINSKTILEYEGAIKLLQTIPGWKDADEKVVTYQKKVQEVAEAERLEREYEEELTRKELKERAKRNKKIALIATPIACVIIMLAIVIFTVIIPNGKYNDAIALMDAGKMIEAYEIFCDLGDYKDSTTLAQKCAYSAGEQAVENDKVSAALMFGKAGDYQDAKDRSFELWKTFIEHTTIDCGYEHIAAIQNTGLAIGAGRNDFGQTTFSNEWNDLVSISAGDFHTVGLKSDGSAVATGQNDDGQCDVSSWHNIVAISAGDSCTVGLQIDGTIVYCGRPSSVEKQLAQWQDIIAIDADGDNIVGLKADGTVVAVADYESYGETAVERICNIKKIAAGGFHNTFITENGTVVGVGRNSERQLELGNWSDIVDIDNGSVNTVGLRTDGTVVTAGESQLGELSCDAWHDIVAVSIDHCTTVGLKSDGTVLIAGDTGKGMIAVEGWKDIRLPKVFP